MTDRDAGAGHVTAPPLLSLGLYLPMTATAGSTGQLVAEVTRETLAAEQAGLDIVLVPEHHSGPPVSLTSPTTLTSWLLAQTATIKIGPGVMLPALQHSAHIAEWAALLQHASGNRLVLGVGPGYQAQDFERFGVEHARRGKLFEEALAGVRDCWRSVSHGTMPELDRDREPQIWIGAWTSRTVRRAALLGDVWLVDPMRTVCEIESMEKIYRSAATAAGRAPRVVVIRELWVDETDALARTRYEPHARQVVDYYRRRGALGETDATVESLTRERIVCGSPATVAAELVELVRRTSAETVIATLRQPGGPAHEHVLEAIRLLGEDVLPDANRALSNDRAGARA